MGIMQCAIFPFPASQSVAGCSACLSLHILGPSMHRCVNVFFPLHPPFSLWFVQCSTRGWALCGVARLALQGGAFSA